MQSSSFLYASPGLKLATVGKASAIRQTFTLPLFLSVLLTVSLFFGTAARAQEPPSIAPTVRINPTAGPPTTTVLVQGNGFDPYAAVDIYFDLTDLALTVTNGGGSFGGGALQGGIPVPVPKDAAQGTHWITAVERYGIKAAQTKFVVGTDWAQFHYSPDHQGFNPYETVLSPDTVGNLSPRWKYTTANEVYASPAVAHGVVYVGSTDSNLYALNGSTGALLWKAGSYGVVVPSPAVVNGVVYSADFLGHVYALNASTGAVVGAKPVPGGHDLIFAGGGQRCGVLRVIP